jgi:protease-4
MKKFLLGVLAGVLLAGVSAIVIIFALVKFSSRTPPLPDRMALVIRLSGEFPEAVTIQSPFPALESSTPLTIAEVYGLFREAARDSRVVGLVVEPSGLAAGWGKLEELRQGIEAFKRSGKPVAAWLRAPGMREYYVAAAADRVYLSPEDMLDVKGLRIEAMYFKGTLDKLGIQMEVEHAGKYKDAGDVYSRTSMSPETREALNSILDELYPRVLGALAQGRHKRVEEVRALVDQGPFLAPKAQAAGLVDALEYRNRLMDRLAGEWKVERSSFVPERRYLSSSSPSGRGRRVALLVAQGDILRADLPDWLGNDRIVSPAGIARLVRDVQSDPGLAGIIVRVDSPGGDAVASDEILDALKVLNRKKPVVISMSDLAASGGYYISMTGDPVVAYPGTLTGSIGVVYGKPNLHGLLDKLGISSETLTRGRFADIDSTSRPLTPEARQKLREGIDFIYHGFLTRVAEGRRRKVEEIEPVAQGRVWLGSQAKANGLVDELGGLTTAIDLIRKKANIGAGVHIRLSVYPQRRTWFQQLFRSPETAAFDSAPAVFLLRRAGPGIAPWVQGGVLSVLPWRIEIR